MTTIRSRARLRGATEWLAGKLLAGDQHTPGELAAPAAEAPVEPACTYERVLGPGHFADAIQNRASTELYERLSAADVADIRARIGEVPELELQYVDAYNDAARRHMTLAFGISLGLECVPAKTGLIKLEPPEEIHVMTRGPLASAGGLYEADMIVDALRGSGTDLADIGAALDFGCSSGRVLSVLSAAYPQTQWRGCDPNAPAIEWAAGTLPGVEFFVSDNSPPLPLADASLDLVYAISIWSHFAPQLGLRWFEEARRVLRPGGHLVCTTHGLTSIAHDSNGRSPEQTAEILDALYREGSWYAAEFGEEGDWGVVNPEWGTAFLSPEWMLTQLCPRWQVLEFAPGRNQENQDVYVLRRV